MLKLSFASLLGFILLAGCSSGPEPQETLRSVDVIHTDSSSDEVFVKPKSEEEIKDAYYKYIKSASKDDKARFAAINRLAELELNRINEIVKNSTNAENEEAQDALYRQSLLTTLNLLQTSLRDYPDAKGNDKTLYQLARTLDQLGEPEKSLEALVQLSDKYPSSSHYSEAQFRIGENAFISGDFIAAEDAYSAAILASAGDVFYERSLFKRGWARYKQGLYVEAADDYLAALKNHQFDDYEKLSNSEKDQFDEYFRAIGLAFANLQSADALQDYFVDEADFQYLYHTYAVVSDIYLKQERYSDAAETLTQFISANPESPKIPLAYLKVIEIWKIGGFKNRFQDELEVFYTHYHPKSKYWNNSVTQENQKQVFDSLRGYSLLVMGYYQEDYQSTRKSDSFKMANKWYRRYLDNYSAYAHQDKVYNLYAELLAAENQDEEAIHYFELAAYDGDIILNKEAAYATIDLSHKLHQKDRSNTKWIDKHITYSLRSIQIYSNDIRYHAVALHAAELAFNNKRYQQAIELTNALPGAAADETLYKASLIKANAYLHTKDFQQAETIFSDLAMQNPTQGEKLSDNIALAIYRQAEEEQKNQQSEAAIIQFARVSERVPASEIAPKALYEAISLSMKFEQWDKAILYIQRFQQLYPKHSLYSDTTRQLSSAYLNSGQGVKAAEAFEKISAQEENQDVKMAALWQAAELYESKNNIEAAIRSYRNYANAYTRPYPQYLEAMYKLTQLYPKTKEREKTQFWQEKIALSDKQASRNLKTDRTNFIAANVALDLAKAAHVQFSQKRLAEPLAESLRAKKKIMQETIALYGQASTHNYADITTEATYAIGNIYQEFSAALLTAERPRNLRGEELEQYNILIEDQAFPFEEKAIEFYEINLARIKDGIKSPWVSQSYTQLTKLFPVRYNRPGKISIYKDETP